jgi:hypothetical protein
MFNLSGAINVLLLLIVRPQLLLLTRPSLEEFDQPGIELPPRSTGNAVLSDAYQHSPEPTSTALAPSASPHSVVLTRVSSKPSI